LTLQSRGAPSVGSAAHAFAALRQPTYGPQVRLPPFSAEVPHTCPLAQSVLVTHVQMPAGLHFDVAVGHSTSREQCWGTTACMRNGQLAASIFQEQGVTEPQFSAHPGRPHHGA
jgi:hypothetical protein